VDCLNDVDLLLIGLFKWCRFIAKWIV